MRPISEVRRANVRFTSECLGFSNVPESKTLNYLFDGQSPVCHHPKWKSRVPRDTGSAWDFEDIRDFYLKEIFQKDPVPLRCFDMDQYLSLSRVTTGEVMEQVYSEWRSAHNQCGGALVWLYKDLWPGSGWGIIDSNNLPKACYYYLKRVMQPLQLTLTDEGLDGIHIHIINEAEKQLNAILELTLLRNDQIVVARQTKECDINGRSTLTLIADEMLGGFYDISYAYRFGPQNHDVVSAILKDKAGNTISEAFHFTGKRKLTKHRNVNLIAYAVITEEGNYLLSLRSDTFLQAVHFDVSGFLPQDNYFHLMPETEKRILFEHDGEDSKKFRAYIEALNLDEPIKISVKNSP
jgi:beta-mannosidase